MGITYRSVGIQRDLDRFRRTARGGRSDLEQFIVEGENTPPGEDVRIPEGTDKRIDLPGFEYAEEEKGVIVRGDELEEGDVVEAPDGPEDGEPGDEPGDHERSLSPEEFARRLDEELGLDLEPKGKRTKQEDVQYTDTVSNGPRSALDISTTMENGLKRAIPQGFDEEYAREMTKVGGADPQTVFRELRNDDVSVSLDWVEDNFVEEVEYDGFEHFREENEPSDSITTPADQPPFRRDDMVFRAGDPIEEPDADVVVVNMLDTSGSMGGEKRDLSLRVLYNTANYLAGKYDNAEFVYITHDTEAQQRGEEEFRKISTGGGTVVSSAYDRARETLEEEYPWSEWNRYVFAAGDGENRGSDTEDNILPMMDSSSDDYLPANRHAYAEVQPSGSNRSADLADNIVEHFDDMEDTSAGRRRDDVAVARVEGPDDITPAIETFLGGES